MTCASVETLREALTKRFARTIVGLYLLFAGSVGIVASCAAVGVGFGIGAFGSFELSSDLLDASLELLLLRIPIDGLVVEAARLSWSEYESHEYSGKRCM